MAKPAFIPIPKFVKDYTGLRFGRLVVLGLLRLEVRSAGAGTKRVPVFLAKCDCGNTKEGLSRNLRNGLVQSCGCLQRETRVKSGRASRTHGMRDTPEYAAWHSMKNRCQSPTSQGYAGYGGRGITVCDRWSGSFETFYQDMGARPSPAHSLDRIDCNGNYEPANCRWATIDVQNTNRRTTVFIEMNGETISLSEAARRCGLSRSALGARYASGLRGAELFERLSHEV